MKLLICSDGHAAAEHALRFISRTAAACQAEVTLLGIIENPGDEAPLVEALRKAAGVLRERGVVVETVTRPGQPIEQIRARTAEIQYDFVVIGGEVRREGAFALSSKAYHLIKQIEPPVLVVVGDRPDLHRVLLCTGGGRSIGAAVDLTGRISCKANLEIMLFHVLPEAPVIYGTFMNCEEQAEQLLSSNSALGKNLRTHKASLEAVGARVSVKVCSGTVPARILQEIREGDYDLIVTGSAPRRGAMHTYMLGNITSEIVNRARTPVMVVRGTTTAAAEGLGRRLWRKLFASG